MRVHYPAGWTEQTPAQGDQSVMGFASPDKTVFSSMYVFAAQAGDTPESTINSLSSSALTGLTNVVIVSNAALTRSDGTPAWSQVVTAQTNSNSDLKINLTHSNLRVTLIFYADVRIAFGLRFLCRTTLLLC